MRVGKGIAVAVVIFTLLCSSVLIDLAQGQTVGPDELFSPFVSYQFVQNSQNIEENGMLSLRDIFYYVSILNISGDPVTGTERQTLIDRVRSYQNADGGFGDWYNDRSKAGTTLTALETLKELGSGPLNMTGAIAFLEKLQVSGLDYGNFGFRSSVKERDADISSTYDVLEAMSLTGTPPPNIDGVKYYVKDHQNFDGGFGYQTNRESGVFWDSTVLHTQRGLLALKLLGEEPTYRTQASSFIRGNQDSTGGFSNTDGEDARVSYTYNAVTALLSLGETVPRQSDVSNFIASNQLSSGGFLEYSLDTKEGLHSTYFAITALELLNGQYDKNAAVDFARNYVLSRLDGGFGDYPGLGSTSRITFDAISALNRIGKQPEDRGAAVDFIRSLRNPDGGFGESGSNIETTYRAVLSLNMLEEPLIDPQDTIDYIRGLQNNDGGFGFASGYVSRGAYTYRAVRTLNVLGKAPFEKDGAVRYLRSLQNPDGGYGNYFGEQDSDLTSTYRAVRGLHILGSIPLDRSGAVSFIHGSQNPDGGYRRSPGDTTAPSNFSTSLFTYDAVMSLFFLGEEPRNKAGVFHFVESLRNPDLGFGEKEFFTSRVSDTYTSLWTYMVMYRADLDHAPVLSGSTVAPAVPTTSDTVVITVNYMDPEGQRPEFVLVEVDGIREYMAPGGNGNYSFKGDLPPGDHPIRILASDGINPALLDIGTISVSAVGSYPNLVLKVDPEEGLDDTTFIFSVEYSHPDNIPASRVEIEIDEGGWLLMDDAEGEYQYFATLTPGIHMFRARAFDGTNYGYTDRLTGPIVHPRNSTKPEWDVFLKIRDLIERKKGHTIGYDDVERENHNGKLAWKVTLPDEVVHVSNDGEEILDGKSDEGISWTSWLLLIFVILTFLIVVGFIIFTYVRKRSEPGEDGPP
ncbi:MAG: prenyltransferase/squalene oxidase repeat-containing protein [Thermoplasmatota archaeon]